MKSILLTLLLSLAACAQTGPFTVSGNFPRDLYGPEDTRLPGQSCNVGPCIWGHADSDTLVIPFHPPAGYRVRILSLRGDVQAWIKSLPGDQSTPPESSAGVLFGIQSTNTEGADRCGFCASGTLAYLQGVITEKQPGTRMSFDYEHVDMLLEADNLMTIKLAVFLSTVGKPIHMECDWVATVVWERVEDPQ